MEPENPWAAPRAHTVARPTSVEAPDRRLFWAMMAMEVGVTLFNVIAAITAIDRVHGPGVLAAYSATLAMLTGVEACWTWRLLLAAEGRGGPGRIPALLAALLAQIPMFGWPFWLLALRDAWQKLGDDDAPAPMWGEVDTPGEDVTEESPARSTGTPSFPMARGAMPRPKEHDLAQLRAQVEAPTELEFRAPTPAPMPPRVRPGAPPSPIPAGPSLGLDGYDEEEAPESEPVVAAVAVAPQGSGMPFGFRRETLLGVTAAVACLSAGGMLALALGISRGSIDLRPRDIAGETQALIAAPDPGEEIPDPGVPVAPSPEGAAAAQGAIPLPAALSAAASAPAPEPAAAPPRPDGVETSLPRRNTRSSGRTASGSAADPERAPAPAPASAAPASAAPAAAPAASGARRITPVAPADPAPAPQPGAVPWRNPKGDGPSRPADNGGRAAVLNELDY